jgi:hypothetical protein
VSGAALRWAGVAAAGAAIVTAAALAPGLLRRAEMFRVLDVEVLGTYLLPAASAVQASGIADTSSVFDDSGVWRDALRGHPLVADARISRRLPGTIVLHIKEPEPLALVRTPALRPVDGTGRVLPVPPGTAELDLPVVAGDAAPDADGFVKDEAVLGVLDVLLRVRTAQPSLWPWISEAQPARGGDVRLTLRWPDDAELWLPAAPDAQRLEEVGLVLAELGSTRSGPDTTDATMPAELGRLARIDARFHEQIVVTLGRSPRDGARGMTGR